MLKNKIKLLPMKSVLLNFIGLTTVILVFSYLHLLRWEFTLLLIIAILIVIPFVLVAEYKYSYEKNRFNEMCLYMKHVIINYKIKKKVLNSLQDTLGIFEDGSEMKVCIEKAISSILNGNYFDVALQEIENKYCNSYIRQIHLFMILGEKEVGTSVHTSLTQINIKEWQKDVELFEENKFKIKTRCIWFAIGSLLMTYYTLYQLIDYKVLLLEDANYQIMTFTYLFIMIITYAASTFLLSGKWINEEE
ncbi:MAG: hypothetical protein RR909_03160 [Bacilli bacterium]